MPGPFDTPAPKAADSTVSAQHAADLQLASRALAGEPDARRTLGERFDCTVTFARSVNRRHGEPLLAHECQDLAQDASAIAWRRLPDFEGRAALETWVYRIVSFEFLNHVRRKQSRKARTEGSLDDTQPVEMTRSPDFTDLHQGLAGLTPAAQTVIDLKHYQDKTFDEIAEQLALSPSAVKRLYYGAIKALRTKLTEGEE